MFKFSNEKVCQAKGFAGFKFKRNDQTVSFPV